jgi:hypothetical protein
MLGFSANGQISAQVGVRDLAFSPLITKSLGLLARCENADSLTPFEMTFIKNEVSTLSIESHFTWYNL